MEDPLLYALHRKYPVRDTTMTLQTLTDKISWQPEAKILDIGCGCGSTTFDLLLPHLPKNFSNLTGIDISEKMIKHCQLKSNDTRINFMKLDFGTDEIPEEFKNNFNHVFSFFSLHWIQDQRKLFGKIHEVLTPGGSVLANAIADSPIYDIYENLAKMEEWASYNNKWCRFRAPYTKYKDVQEEMENILSSTGFSVSVCKVRNKDFTFPNIQELREFYKSICALIPDIPADKVEHFMDDYIDEVRKHRSFTFRVNKQNEEEIHVRYKLLEILCFRK